MGVRDKLGSRGWMDISWGIIRVRCVCVCVCTCTNYTARTPLLHTHTHTPTRYTHIFKNRNVGTVETAVPFHGKCKLLLEQWAIKRGGLPLCPVAGSRFLLTLPGAGSHSSSLQANHKVTVATEKPWLYKQSWESQERGRTGTAGSRRVFSWQKASFCLPLHSFVSGATPPGPLEFQHWHIHPSSPEKPA